MPVKFLLTVQVEASLKLRMTVTMTIAVLLAFVVLGRLHKLSQAEHKMADKKLIDYVHVLCLSKAHTYQHITGSIY
jgi:signal transduction histidine kinase